MQISRLFEIVYILLNGQVTTAKELAEHFEVSTRTIYRDIDALSAAGIPVYASQGKGGGISLLEAFVLNKSLLSEQEQNGILLALQTLNATQFPDTELVLSKLNRIFRKDSLSWIEVDFSSWGSTQSQKEKFDTLKSAILSSRIIAFQYFSSAGVKSSRSIEPIKLVFKDKAWYLQGFCLAAQDMRTFKVGRIVNLEATASSFLPRNLELPVVGQESTYGPMFPLQLRISPEGAFRVYDEFNEYEVYREADGSFRVNTSMPDGEWLYSYILSFGIMAEVLEPVNLRQIIAERAAGILSKYGGISKI